MQSMTGYGMGTYAENEMEITIELKAVNHRFLDLSFRVPRAMSFLEESLRKWIQGAFTRGHIDVFLTYVNTAVGTREAAIDRDIVGAYLDAALELRDMGVRGSLTVSDVLRIQDAVRLQEREQDQQELIRIAKGAFDIAAEQLAKARAQEGQRMKEDIASRLALISQKRDLIALREPLVVQDYRDRLLARVASLAEGVQIDEARLAQEVAFFADRASIAEELARLASHVQAILMTMDGADASIGRKLDFIVQELNREANTIGSKASDLTITQLVVDVKAEIEKIREQVQNIE